MPNAAPSMNHKKVGTISSVLVFKTISISLLIVLVAAVVYHLHGSYLLGQFDSALMTTHELAAAETKFAKTHPDRGYTCDLSELIKEDDHFKEAHSLSTKGQRSGYSFLIKGCDKDTTGNVTTTYEIVARPLGGGGNICADQSGRVWFYDPKCDQE